MPFNPEIGVTPLTQPLGFSYERGSFGPQPELRPLDAIRPSLRDPNCDGPDPVYAIVMDIGRNSDRALLQQHMFLYGAVTYAAGRLGSEPVRSQGHLHRVSKHSGWSPPEIYEIWEGQGCIYMQENAADDPGRCFAISGGPGTIIVTPPGWPHAIINMNPAATMTFSALCDREYGFEYAEVRTRKGLAWYPLFNDSNAIRWEANPLYKTGTLEARGPRDYSFLGLKPGIPLYAQATSDPGRLQWVSQPALAAEHWPHFVP